MDERGGGPPARPRGRRGRERKAAEDAAPRGALGGGRGRAMGAGGSGAVRRAPGHGREGRDGGGDPAKKAPELQEEPGFPTAAAAGSQHRPGLPAVPTAPTGPPGRGLRTASRCWGTRRRDVAPAPGGQDARRREARGHLPPAGADAGLDTDPPRWTADRGCLPARWWALVSVFRRTIRGICCPETRVACRP